MTSGPIYCKEETDLIAGIQDEILRLHAMGLLDRLLVDKATKARILWGTDAYENRGPEYKRNHQITPALITGENADVIKTRARKALEQQTERTRRHAEVFTPPFLCARMISAADASWFGTATDKFLTDQPVRFTKSRTWKHYVDSRRLEITCGEAPYLVSRYDASTGEAIPIRHRIGLLDRKLRAVNENAADEEEWLKWTLRAFQATYGYEFQGDNLLIARVNLLMTYEEYLYARWKRKPSPGEYRTIVNTITWNIWQMDGLTGQIPYSREDDWQETNLFKYPETGTEQIQQPDCRIYDWRRQKSLLYQNVNTGGRNMKFDFIIGNPPYQDGDSSASRKPPMYHLFMDASYKLSKRVELITPARFLFNAGQTPPAWNNKMLNDPHLKILYYEPDSSKIFPNIDIRGGVVITYHDINKNFEIINIFTPFPTLTQIVKKVNAKTEKSLNSIIFSQGLYHFSQKFFDDFPTASHSMGAGTGNKIVSAIFEKFPEPFMATPSTKKNCIKLLGRTKEGRVYRYVKREYIIQNECINFFNVFVPEGNGSGKFGEPLAPPIIGEPGTGHTDTFISIGKFPTVLEAEACVKYIKSKFVRALLGVLKATQHNPPSTWKYVPLQDFTANSDIDWSQPVADIDRQLYQKYGLNDKEISFIETHVKEMK